MAQRAPRFRYGVLLMTVVCCCTPATSATAHQRPISIEQWGPFLPGTVTCLRALSRVGRTCFAAVVDIRNECEEAMMRGDACDAEAAEARIATETARIRTAILENCEPGQLTELQYVGGALDAQADHSNACRDQASATMAMTYAPVAGSGAAAALPSQEIECIEATAEYGRKILRYITRRKARVMERIGARLLTGSQKVALMQRIGRSLIASEARWAAGLSRACPSFEEVYGRTTASFVHTLKERADCVLTATHGNNSLICIPQVCPNGIRESGEECDDGNIDDTDACGTDCKAN
jgi:cysteine-rich repeat protein